MSSVPEDRTGRAAIRDEALRLFAAHGPDAVTMRQIAAAAGVSPALVVHHFGSKAGLEQAVLDHVVAWMDDLMEVTTTPEAIEDARTEQWAGLGDLIAERLGPDNPVVGYVRWLFLSGHPAGAALLARWHATSLAVIRQWADAGVMDAGPDPATRAAVLMTLDLGTVLLGPQWATVLGYDPLTGGTTSRWGEEALRLFSGLLNPPPGATPDPGTDSEKET